MVRKRKGNCSNGTC